MTRLEAAWVVPVDQPPIRDGWVAVEAGRIVALGRGGDGPGQRQPLGPVALMPGLINAHVHLELSWLCGQVPPAVRFTDWVRGLMARRRDRAQPDEESVRFAARAAAGAARRCGTAAVGDISNALATVDVVEAVGLAGVVFHELIGFRDSSGDLVARTRRVRTHAARGRSRVRVSVAPHAPYSVSPALFRAIRDELAADGGAVTSVHVGESPEEIELLATGTGEWRRLLSELGAWHDDWRPPGTGPVEYLDDLGLLSPSTLAVHGVHLGDESLARLAGRGATLVTCPRSNQWVGAGSPPVRRFYDSGLRVAVGTDSLASVPDLNLFEELKTLRALAPDVPARRLLESATLCGARALGLGDDLGSLAPGKRAEVIAVALPPGGVDDVEEHLVGRVHADEIAWAAQGTAD